MIKNNLIKIIFIILFTFYFGCNGGGHEPEGLAPIVSLSTSSSSIIIGEIVVLNVNVANVENLYAISFEILFDSNLVSMNLSSGGISDDFFTNDNFGPVAYSDEGVISLALGGNSLDGKIFSVSITGLKVGVANISLSKVNLIQNDGTDVVNYDLLKLEDVNIEITSQ